MNIPRQFYGVNYLSKILANFQDSDISKCPQLHFHEIEDVEPAALEKKDTYSLGIRAEEISKLLRSLAKQKSCGLDGLAICRGESLIFAGYRPPYRESEPRITNSTCKTVTAIGIMFAISENLLKEEDLVLSFFPEYETMITPKYVRQMTVRHLLTMTSGSKCNETISVTEDNWVKAFLTSECQYEPGTQFVYNSMNTYMLAAILTRVTGQSVTEYLKKRFFAPLGINHIKWELCPMGIERGGWGLHISLEGMLKIGIFLANDGSFMGKQLIHPSYIRKMKQTKVKQETDSLSTGYGYQLWHLPKGLYMLSGMYGQHVIIDEKNQLIVATNAHIDKTCPDSWLVRRIIAFMTSPWLYQTESKIKEIAAYRSLHQEFQAFCSGWNLSDMRKNEPFLLFSLRQKKCREAEVQKLQRSFACLDQKRLHIDQAAIKLFPYMLQGMYQCPPFNVSDISFRMLENSVKLCFFKERGKHERKRRERLFIEAGFLEYCYQTIRIGENDWQIAVKAYPASDEENRTVIMLDIVFLAAGFSRLIKFFLTGKRVGIECQEYPDMRVIVEEAIYGETVIAGNTIDLTNKLPESMRVFLEHKVEPKVTAYFAENRKRKE